MANVNEDINDKYCGSVTVLNAGSYTDFTDFVGGNKVAEIAKTYLNRSELRYGDNSYAVKFEPTSFDNPAVNLNKWYDSSINKANIDCSTLAILSYKGISYEKSPYNNHKMTSIKCNTSYSWIFNLPRTAAEQAEYCVKNGWVLHGADLTKFSNLESGDLLFYDRDNGENGRYMNCSHVAICIGKIDGVTMLIEATTVTNGVRTKAVESSSSDKLLFVARPKKH